MSFFILTPEHIEDAASLFIEVFTGPPWFDSYDSRSQVTDLIGNYLNCNYGLCFGLKEQDTLTALALGMQKPWIRGLEYYLDEFCVKPSAQRQGKGSHFLKLVDEAIKERGMNAILLNTQRGYPAESFYLKNGFKEATGLITLYR